MCLKDKDKLLGGHALKRRLRVRVRHGMLRSFLALGFALYLVGVANDSEPAHFISRILLFVPVVSFVLGLTNMSGVSCKLQYAKPRLWEGQNADLHLKLTNHGSLSKLNFLFRVAILNRTLNLKRNGGWLIPSIAGEQSINSVVPIPGLKRGENRIECFGLACDSPFSIFSLEREYSGDSSCIVYPRLLCDPEAIISSSFASARAFTVRDPFDYRCVREYVPTDDLRFVHWMCSARRGELVVRVPERYGVAPCALILSAPDGARTNDAWDDEPILEHMIRFTATLAIALSNAGFSVNVLTGAWKVHMKSKGSGEIVDLLEHLARLTYREASLPISVACHLNCNHPFGPTVLLVTCDAAREAVDTLLRWRGAQASASNGIVICFCACDDGEHPPVCLEAHHVKCFSVCGSNKLLPTLEACFNSLLMAYGVQTRV